MAKVYLDTNIFIDVVERGSLNLLDFKDHAPFISPLSVHILSYAYKYKMPIARLEHLIEEMNIVDFTQQTLELALIGPTDDIEDNIHLHSAAHSDCDYFVTKDKELLKIKFFGKVKIISSLK